MSDPELSSDALSAPQRRVLEAIERFLEERGLPPTVREIGKLCGIASTGSVAFHMKALEAAGFLKRTGGALSRGLELARPPGRLPVLGRVGAGGGVLAQEDKEGDLDLPKGRGRGADFALRVRGESMRDAGILEGDLVLVRRQPEAREGETVVALLPEQESGVVKVLRKRRDRWVLESAHPDYPPITESFQILGKVVGLWRDYP